MCSRTGVPRWRAPDRASAGLGMADSGAVGALVVALVAAGLALSSCGEFPFSVRPSKAPTGGGASSIIPATDPDAVISNLANSVAERNVEDYVNLFSEDLAFFADPRDVADLENSYPGAFDDWVLDVERSVMGYVFETWASAAEVAMDTDPDVIEDTQTTYIAQYDYELVLVIDVTNIETYQGQARISMKKLEDNLWRIYKWEDIRPAAAQNPTWGYIKGWIRATT